MTLQAISDLRGKYARLAADLRAINERVDYLTVAACRGDPRFARDEYAKPDFDCDAFDEWWRGKGKRVPPLEEVFG